MTYRPRPDREALVLAAVDLALTDEAQLAADLGAEDRRPAVLAILLEALGVPADDVEVLSTAGSAHDASLTRREVAEELVRTGLVLDEADVQGADGDRLRELCRPESTTAQREAELEYVRRAFDDHVRAAVESLPPSTIVRP